VTKAYYSGPIAEMAARLRAAREKHGVNQATAARLMGMTPSRLGQLESARLDIKAADVALIARVTGADPAWLLMGEEGSPERAPIEVPNVPESYRKPPGQQARTRNREQRHAEQARPPRRREGPTWRPAGIGRDLRPTTERTEP
jgi:transcriptional regulator with XRE-family HTH domain